ncbi:MAG: hypothetical protein COV59_04015 [Candidatus Magasanikbacteria bacterium CG11_big_fil_rev_8_21_14_0_20_39_34]|uniref:Uncharacterized protein n=1 Tax=Candidatus Magasanikbacteria bacterium CG11_big_fil_rev_8_21_14_0_20_39_34 TaxID=1974653 RepID=A0A2H0N4I8_9BACT|nr:MAG: hypothetical protein COV59_04015 [Candidatus Magasanikbacteria bacterium CG11_big_fil_rev_8_21_14_0_20_39_34]
MKQALQKFFKKERQAFFLFCLVGIFVFACPALAFDDLFPRKVNYFLNWSLTDDQARQLAKWDVVILDMEIQARRPDLLKKMREYNPNIKLLVFVSPLQVQKDSYSSVSSMRREFGKGLKSEWYLKDPSQQRKSWWEGTYLMNISNVSPKVGSQRYNEYLVNFVTQKLLSSGLWDGVFYDNAWEQTQWFIQGETDIDNDGIADNREKIDMRWQDGMRFIYDTTREKISEKDFIVGNGFTTLYNSNLNGLMIENFDGHNWEEAMKIYKDYDENNSFPYALNLVNSNSNNTGNQNDFRAMRYGLASTLLGDGYYSFDHGDAWHGQTWWYDEYNVNLGKQALSTKSIDGKKAYQEGVWFREFENGLVLVNSSEKPQMVELPAEFEKIRGQQDPKTNDGRILSQVYVPPKDGLLLQRVIDPTDVRDIFYKNGVFAQFFTQAGKKARNGLFLFDDTVTGGDLVGDVDVNGDSLPDFFSFSHGRLTVLRHDGQKYFSRYPFGASYDGDIKIFLQKMGEQGKKQIVVVPKSHESLPIKVYTYSGVQIGADWYPFGKSYQGEYLATDYLDGFILANQRASALDMFVYNGFDVAKSFSMNFSSTQDIAFLGNNRVAVLYKKSSQLAISIIDILSQKIESTQVLELSFKEPMSLQLTDVNFDGENEIIVLGGI